MKPVERVGIIIKFKGVSISAFEKATGMSNNSIQTAIKRVSNLKDDTLNSILNCFPDISAEWLLTGKGSMINNHNPDTAINDTINYKEIAEARLEIIEGLKFKVLTLEKEIAELKYV